MKEEYKVTRKTKDIKKKQAIFTNEMDKDILNVLETKETFNEFIRVALAKEISNREYINEISEDFEEIKIQLERISE